MKKPTYFPVNVQLPPNIMRAVAFLAKQEEITTDAMIRRLVLRGIRETLHDEEMLQKMRNDNDDGN